MELLILQLDSNRKVTSSKTVDFGEVELSDEDLDHMISYIKGEMEAKYDVEPGDEQETEFEEDSPKVEVEFDNEDGTETEVEIEKDGDEVKVSVEKEDGEEEDEEEGSEKESVTEVQVTFTQLNNGEPLLGLEGNDNVIFAKNVQETEFFVKFELNGTIYKIPLNQNGRFKLNVIIDSETYNLEFRVEEIGDAQNEDGTPYNILVNI